MHTYLGGTVLKGEGGEVTTTGEEKKGSVFSTSRELTDFYILLSFSQFPLTATILSSQEKVYLCETH